MKTYSGETKKIQQKQKVQFEGTNKNTGERRMIK